MVANPNTLYLQELPRPSNIVQLTPLPQDGISQQALMLLLAMMTQTLLDDVSKMSGMQASHAQHLAETAQDWVGAAQSQLEQTKQAEQAYQQALDAQKNPPWWQQLIDILVKYVLPAVIVLVAGIAFGPVAAAATLAVILATTVPVKDGKSLVGLAASAIAQALSKACGLNAGETEIAEGVTNVVLAVVLAVASGGASAAFAVEEGAATAVEEAVAEEAEEGASTASSGAAKMVGLGTFATVTGNTNAWYDIAFGTWQVADTNSKDQDTGKIVASIINTIITLVLSFASLKIGGSALAASDETSTLAEWLGPHNLLKFQKIMNLLVGGTLVAKAGSLVNQGFQVKQLRDLQAEMTESKALLKLIEGFDQMASQSSTSMNATLKSTLQHFTTMLSRDPNYALVEFTAAREMQRA
jgi:hypothetical protein